MLNNSRRAWYAGMCKYIYALVINYKLKRKSMGQRILKLKINKKMNLTFFLFLRLNGKRV